MTTIDLYSKNQSDDLFDKKQDTLKSGENIKTINGASIVGGGNLVVDGAVLVSSSIPSSAILGQLWYEPTTDRIFICTHPSSSTTRPTFGLLFDNSGSVEHSRWGDITGDIHQQLDLMLELATKQGLLTAEGKIKIENDTITVDLSDYFTKEEVTVLVDNKQDKLTAGANISIENNVISASVPDVYTKAETDALLAEKQNELSSVNEGNNIKITYDATGNPLINATGSGGSEYTGIAPIVVDNTADTIGIQPTGVGSGSVGSSTRVPVIGYDNNGRIVSVSDVPVSGGSYTPGEGIDISNNEISVMVGSSRGIGIQQNSIVAQIGNGLQFDSQGRIEATGTTLEAGDGIEIANNEISAKLGDGLQFDSSGAIEVVGGSGGVESLNTVTGALTVNTGFSDTTGVPIIGWVNSEGTSAAFVNLALPECGELTPSSANSIWYYKDTTTNQWVRFADGDTVADHAGYEIQVEFNFTRTYRRIPFIFVTPYDSEEYNDGDTCYIRNRNTNNCTIYCGNTGYSSIQYLIIPNE